MSISEQEATWLKAFNDQKKEIASRDSIIAKLEERLSFLKDEERMRQRLLELQEQNRRLKSRFYDASQDVTRAAKKLQEMYSDDLSKIELLEIP